MVSYIVLQKIRNNQKNIATNENLKDFGYCKNGKSLNGTILWGNKGYLKNKREKKKDYMKRYYKQNKDKIHQKQKDYKNKNIEKIQEYRKIYYKEHKEELSRQHKDYQKEYCKTIKGKFLRKKTFNKRQRNLGFIPINKNFRGGEK